MYLETKKNCRHIQGLKHLIKKSELQFLLNSSFILYDSFQESHTRNSFTIVRFFWFFRPHENRNSNFRFSSYHFNLIGSTIYKWKCFLFHIQSSIHRTVQNFNRSKVNSILIWNLNFEVQKLGLNRAFIFTEIIRFYNLINLIINNSQICLTDLKSI